MVVVVVMRRRDVFAGLEEEELRIAVLVGGHGGGSHFGLVFGAGIVCVCVCVCVRACVGRGTERQVGEREREGETGSKGGREIGENPPAGLGGWESISKHRKANGIPNEDGPGPACRPRGSLCHSPCVPFS